MKLRSLLVASAVSIFGMAGAALAQQGATSTLFDAVDGLEEVEDDDRIVQPLDLSADEVDDMDIHNSEALPEWDD